MTALHHPRGTMLAAIVAGCAIVGFAAGAAVADSTDNIVPTSRYSPSCSEGGPGYGVVCQTDNSKVYYYMDSHGDYELESGDQSVVRNMIRSQYSPTHLAYYYDSTPKFSGSGETDIVYQEGSVGDSFDGYTWCNDDSPSPKYTCDQTYVRIRGAGYYTPGLSCHESGHAVGLLHGANAAPQRSNTAAVLGCMKTPVGYSEPLGANQVRNINNLYPTP